jgi:hypothetical protein
MWVPNEVKKFWEQLISYFYLIQYGPHRKRKIQKFYCFIRICCHGNDFTEPLPNNEKGMCIQAHRLMGGVYEIQ